MSITIIASLDVKPNCLENVLTDMKANFSDTRAFDGCHKLDVYQDQQNPLQIRLFQRWQSKGHYEKYLAWRTETGFFAGLAQQLSAPPAIRYFDRVDA